MSDQNLARELVRRILHKTDEPKLDDVVELAHALDITDPQDLWDLHEKLRHEWNHRREPLVAAARKTKVAQQAPFVLQFTNYAGKQLSIPVDPSDWRQGFHPHSGSVWSPTWGQQITIDLRRVANAQAFVAALQAAGASTQVRQHRPKKMRTPTSTPARTSIPSGWGSVSTDTDQDTSPMACSKGGQHEWVDTGTKKTWCKKCDKDGINDMGNIHVAALHQAIRRARITIASAYKKIK